MDWNLIYLGNAIMAMAAILLFAYIRKWAIARRTSQNVKKHVCWVITSLIIIGFGAFVALQGGMDPQDLIMFGCGDTWN